MTENLIWEQKKSINTSEQRKWIKKQVPGLASRPWLLTSHPEYFHSCFFSLLSLFFSCFFSYISPVSEKTTERQIGERIRAKGCVCVSPKWRNTPPPKKKSSSEILWSSNGRLQEWGLSRTDTDSWAVFVWVNTNISVWETLDSLTLANLTHPPILTLQRKCAFTLSWSFKEFTGFVSLSFLLFPFFLSFILSFFNSIFLFGGVGVGMGWLFAPHSMHSYIPASSPALHR